MEVFVIQYEANTKACATRLAESNVFGCWNVAHIHMQERCSINEIELVQVRAVYHLWFHELWFIVDRCVDTSNPGLQYLASTLK